jgi:hypothetical protein
MWENTPEELAQFAEEKRTQGRRDFFQNLLVNIDDTNQRLKNINADQYITTVLTRTEIASVSGGSCWDEDNHYENTVSDKTIQNELHRKFLNTLTPLIKELDIPVIQLEDWLTEKLSIVTKYSYIKEFYEHEYYGNSTTYGIYGLKIEDVVEKFCDEETKEIYQKELQSFVDQPKEKIDTKHKNKY